MFSYCEDARVDLDVLHENLPVHYFDCDRFQTYGYGARQSDCDCTATSDMTALIAELRDLRAALMELAPSRTSIGPRCTHPADGHDGLCSDCRVRGVTPGASIGPDSRKSTEPGPMDRCVEDIAEKITKDGYEGHVGNAMRALVAFYRSRTKEWQDDVTRLRSIGPNSERIRELEAVIAARLREFEIRPVHGSLTQAHFIVASIRAAGLLSGPNTEWQCPSCGATTRARMADQLGPDDIVVSREVHETLRALLAELLALSQPHPKETP